MGSTSHRHTSKRKVVERMKGLVEHIRLFVLFLVCWKLGPRSPPPRVEQLCKVNESKAGASTSASKVEDDSGLHGGEKRVTRACGGVVHEVGLVDATVGGPGSGFA